MSDEFHAIIETGVLQQYVDTYRTVVDEATLYARPSELYGQPVDPAAVAMVNQSLSSGAFESYEVHPSDGGDELRLGLNLNRLSDFLGNVDNDALAELALNQETAKLEIQAGEAEYTMALIDPDSIRDGKAVSEDVIDGTTTDVEMDAGAFSHALDLTDMVTDHLWVRQYPNPDDDNPLHFVGEGDTDDVAIRFGESLHDGSSVDEEAESCLSLDYLNDLESEIPKSATLRVRAGDEHPFGIDYGYAGGWCEVQMMVAPRIKSH